MLEITPQARVSHALTALGEALGAADIDRALTLFQEDCYWRDLVAFTWNIKTMEGKERSAPCWRRNSPQSGLPPGPSTPRLARPTTAG
jgi:hypothetical protein